MLSFEYTIGTCFLWWPRELDGSQFQLLLLLGNPVVPLSDEAAATRRGSPAALAILRPDGEWAYSSRCALRFG